MEVAARSTNAGRPVPPPKIWAMLEAASVILQVAYFKATGGQRLFRMAPLHHHFELSGWSEPKVITRFVILGIIFALLSLATLKLR